MFRAVSSSAKTFTVGARDRVAFIFCTARLFFLHDAVHVHWLAGNTVVIMMTMLMIDKLISYAVLSLCQRLGNTFDGPVTL